MGTPAGRASSGQAKSVRNVNTPPHQYANFLALSMPSMLCLPVSSKPVIKRTKSESIQCWTD